ITPGMSLPEAFGRFDLVNAGLQTADALRRVAAEGVEDLAVDGVIHAEFRFAPMLHTGAGLSPVEVIEAVSAGFDDAHAATGLDARIIVSLMRDQPVEVSLEAVEAAIAVGGRAAGVDVAVAGSAVFGQSDPLAAITALRQEAHSRDSTGS
ncbi:MAG: adenosine deaminase, partial [Acidobacteriota bacterium]